MYRIAQNGRGFRVSSHKTASAPAGVIRNFTDKQGALEDALGRAGRMSIRTGRPSVVRDETNGDAFRVAITRA